MQEIPVNRSNHYLQEAPVVEQESMVLGVWTLRERIHCRAP